MSAGQLRILKSRIKSVENTRKITRAMEMVSAAKLRRFQTLMVKARPYTQELEKILLNLAEAESESSSFSHPFFEAREETNAALFVVTADSGLCGAHNMLLIDSARRLLAQPPAPIPFVYGMGKVGVNALKRSGIELQKTFVDVKAHQVEDAVKEITGILSALYLEKKVAAVHVIYSHVLSATTAKPVLEKLLPLRRPESDKKKTGPSSDYLYEPSPEGIFNRIVPECFEAKIRMIFLESFVAEKKARM